MKKGVPLQERMVFLIPSLWFFVPLIGVIVSHLPIYNNFRQFLFIIPPLFVFAAVGVEQLFNLLQNKISRSVVGLIILVPGIIAMIWLHPYEYVYYNALVGWTGNIDRQYENDYFGTSFCEAGNYLAEHAAPGTKIAVPTSIYGSIVTECAWRDYNLVVESSEYSQPGLAYSVLSSQYDNDFYKFKDMQPVDVIGKGNTVFAVVKQGTSPYER